MELFGSQIAVAYAASYGMKLLKYTKWFPFLQQNASNMNRIFAIIVAFLTSVGIQYTFDSVEGTLVISGLTLASVGHGLWAWFVQFCLQQGAFKVIVQPEEARQQVAGELPKSKEGVGSGTVENRKPG